MAKNNRDHAFVVTKTGLRRFFVVLIVLSLAGLAGYTTWQYQQANEEKERVQQDVERLSDPSEAARDAEKQVIESVKKIAVVPDETPTVSPPITDATELKKQPLYSLVENGDRVLLYASARRQIVYRPSTNQIVLAITLPEDQDEKDQSQADAQAEDTTSQ